MHLENRIAAVEEQMRRKVLGAVIAHAMSEPDCTEIVAGQTPESEHG